MHVEEVTPISTKISRRKKKKKRGNRPPSPSPFFLFFEVITEDIDDRE